jgi:hypothetical protein
LLFEKFTEVLAAKLPKKTQPFFLSLVPGALLAIARCRSTSWRSRSVTTIDKPPLTQKTIYHIPNIGCKGVEIFDTMYGIIIATAVTIRMVLDDSPTKRYGRKTEGGGVPSQSNARSHQR